MYYGSYNDAQYARCKVSKNRWFWVVFDSFLDMACFRSNVYGYESTAEAAEARARQAAGPGAFKGYAYWASDFRKSLRQGTANRRRPAPPPPPWCVVLGLTLPCGIDDVKASYRRLAKAAHPDAGGRAADFIAIESAYREALAYCQRLGSHLAS
jgi:hypothetical protein